MSKMINDPRKPYHRPMTGWWRKNPFFVRYMAREVTAIGVAVYAFILLAGLVALSQGEAAYNGFLAILQHPVSLVLHAVLLVAMVYHTYSWFEIMPKTMPPLIINNQRVSAKTITRTGLTVAVITTATTFLLLWML